VTIDLACPFDELCAGTKHGGASKGSAMRAIASCGAAPPAATSSEAFVLPPPDTKLSGGRRAPAFHVECHRRQLSRALGEGRPSSRAAFQEGALATGAPLAIADGSKSPTLLGRRLRGMDEPGVFRDVPAAPLLDRQGRRRMSTSSTVAADSDDESSPASLRGETDGDHSLSPPMQMTQSLPGPHMSARLGSFVVSAEAAEGSPSSARSPHFAQGGDGLAAAAEADAAAAPSAEEAGTPAASEADATAEPSADDREGGRADIGEDGDADAAGAADSAAAATKRSTARTAEAEGEQPLCLCGRCNENEGSQPDDIVPEGNGDGWDLPSAMSSPRRAKHRYDEALRAKRFMLKCRCFLAKSGFRGVNVQKRTSKLSGSYTYPLHAAVLANDFAAVEALVWAGGDKTKQDSQKLTPSEFARKLNRDGSHFRIVHFLCG